MSRPWSAARAQWLFGNRASQTTLHSGKATRAHVQPARRRGIVRITAQSLHRLPLPWSRQQSLANRLVEGGVANTERRVDGYEGDDPRSDRAVVLARDQDDDALAERGSHRRQRRRDRHHEATAGRERVEPR